MVVIKILVIKCLKSLIYVNKLLMVVTMNRIIKHVKDDFYQCNLTGNIPVNRNGQILDKRGNKTYGIKSMYYVTILNGKQIPIHRIVAITFLDLPKNYQELDVNHIDGNKLNNEISNLEWCTRSENNWHAVKHGLNIQAKRIKVKNLYTSETQLFYSIQHAAKFFNCAGGSVHNYLRHRFDKPFRGHWSCVYEDEEYPKFDYSEITLFGSRRWDDLAIISISLNDSNKHVITPSLEAAEAIFGKIKIGHEQDGYIHCYLKDIKMFTDDIHDILGKAEYKHDKLQYNRKPNNLKPRKVKVVNKNTNEEMTFENAREFASYLGITYPALKRSIWRTKGDFKGYLIQYI